jgi:hypothetical protein
MTEEQIKFLAEFNATVRHYSIFKFCARHSGLQEQSCVELDELLGEIARRKAVAVAANDERFANILLGCECLLAATTSEIRMWILLKAEEPDRAWGQLVNAQSSLSDAMKADEGFLQLEANLDHLVMIERTAFPPQTFLSAGMVVEWEECSICKRDYEDCEHIKGRPYMGHLCTVALHLLEADHIAIVEEPANKHCRVSTFTTPEGHRNKMTWLVEPYKDGEEPPTEGLMARGTIAVLGTSHETLVIKETQPS